MLKHAAMLSLALAITACGSSNSDSTSSNTTDNKVTPTVDTDDSTTPDDGDTTPDEDTSGGEQVIEDTELVLPAQISLVDAKDSSSSSANSISSFAVAEEGGFLEDGTDYRLAEQRTHVWLEALEPLETVDGILCFVSQLKPELEVNEGPYLVLADMDSCFENNTSDTSEDQSSGSEGAVNYTEVIVESTRGDEDDSPLEMKAWFVMDNGDFSQAIRVNGVVNEGASDENPYGSFTLSYQFADALDATDLDMMGKGELATVDTLTGFQGFTLYEESLRGPDEQFTTAASVVVNPEDETGVALTGFQRTGDASFEGNRAFGLSYNSENLLIQDAATFADLPYKNNEQGGVCLSRNSFTEMVWRYGLYSIEDGSEVEIDSGFPFLYDSDGDGANDSRGYASYWGIWTEDEEVDLSGASIQRETFDDSTGDSYSVVQASGRLIKNSVISLALTELDGVQFDYFEWNNEIQDGEKYLIEYNSSEEAFIKVARVEYGEQGKEISELDETEAVVLEDGENLYMYSDQLGGGVQYLAGSDEITFFQQEFVNGSETDTGELFANGTATLYCYKECPISGLTAQDLESYEGPFTGSDDLSSPIQYSISNTGDNALELIYEGVVVDYPEDADSESSSNQHQWGVRSGGMVTDTSDLSSVYDIYNPEVVTVFYEFETGPNSWNQQTALVDASGVVVTFDKPLEFTYRHEDSNDRSGDAGRFDDQTVMLNYGGNGDLWGIPGIVDEERGFYIPAFALEDAVIMGNNDQYVVKALDIEQKMERVDGQCTSLVINDPAAPIPTEVTGELNSDPVPEVTEAPRYIAGVAAEDLDSGE